ALAALAADVRPAAEDDGVGGGGIVGALVGGGGVLQVAAQVQQDGDGEVDLGGLGARPQLGDPGAHLVVGDAGREGGEQGGQGVQRPLAHQGVAAGADGLQQRVDGADVDVLAQLFGRLPAVERIRRVQRAHHVVEIAQVVGGGGGGGERVVGAEEVARLLRPIHPPAEVLDAGGQGGARGEGDCGVGLAGEEEAVHLAGEELRAGIVAVGAGGE